MSTPITATLTIEHSSHPDYLFVSYAQMSISKGPAKVTHHADRAAVDAHVERLTVLAAASEIDFTVIDNTSHPLNAPGAIDVLLDMTRGDLDGVETLLVNSRAALESRGPLTDRQRAQFDALAWEIADRRA
jgi:hypothetical protein